MADGRCQLTDRGEPLLTDQLLVGIGKLGYYADPSAKVFQDLKEVGKAFGMPTTLLVDPHAMVTPESTPLAMLEKLAGARLV